MRWLDLPEEVFILAPDVSSIFAGPLSRLVSELSYYGIGGDWPYGDCKFRTSHDTENASGLWYVSVCQSYAQRTATSIIVHNFPRAS